MKALLLAFMLMFVAAPCFASPCDDTQGAASKAIKERNARVKENHNTTMPDPEEDRGPLSTAWAALPALGMPFPSA